MTGSVLSVKILKEGGKSYGCKAVSLRFKVPQGTGNSEDGGWVGIHPGHEPMLAALDAGEVVILESHTEAPRRIPCEKGFVSVKNDEVNIIEE